MGQIIIDLPSRIKRHYRLDNDELANAILESLEANAMPLKTNPARVRLTAEDKEDVRKALAAETEYLQTGESYSVQELREEFGL